MDAPPPRFDPYRLVRPFLFRLEAERAHDATLRLGELVGHVPFALRTLASPPEARLACSLAGLRLGSPLGLAAGLDKGARLLPLWKALGFGFVEIGTVTPRPQPGNPRPRLFRVPADGLILNRMGFNSEGADVVARRLEKRPAGLVVGGNIGKNKETSEADAAADYASAYERIAPLVDYVVLNISSPNTPGLRDLQGPEAIERLLWAVEPLRSRLGLERQPLLVKLAPDLDERDLAPIVEAALGQGADGLVATNTTVDRAVLGPTARARVEAWGAGGISGTPLAGLARRIRQRVLEVLDERAPLIACGGIGTPQDAAQALADGATAVQIYSALIFEGPMLVRRLNAAL